MLSKIQAVNHRVNRGVVIVLGAICLLGMAFMMVFDASRRTIMGVTTWGLHDIVEIMMSWLIFTAFAYALVANFHVRVTLVLDRLPPRVRFWCEIFGSTIGIIFFGFLLYGAVLYFWDSFLIRESSMSPAMTPLWPSKLAMPVGISLILVEFLLRLIGTLRSGRKVVIEE
ncbi:TRAP transporter small permease, partial [Dehalococcoidia bacterium]|nr:TRAP transporter small permease [Dehalococcoidia bacterium]